MNKISFFSWRGSRLDRPAANRPHVPPPRPRRKLHGLALSQNGWRVSTICCKQYVDQNKIAGAVALVLRDGKPVYEHAFGWRDKEAGRPMTPNTIFRIASQTKAFTSVVILSLVEEGKIGLSEPVGHFIPTFLKTTVAVGNEGGVKVVPAKRAITIHDLLTHTAGISYGTRAPSGLTYEGKVSGLPLARVGIRRTRTSRSARRWSDWDTLPFVAQPGEALVYGYNTDILGCVAETCVRDAPR